VDVVDDGVVLALNGVVLIVDDDELLKKGVNVVDDGVDDDEVLM
jgi:hypothetical protein